MEEKSTESIEFSSPIRFNYKWTHYKTNISLEEIKKHFVEKFEEKYWVEAKKHFDVYYTALLKSAQPDIKKYYEDYRNIIFQFYIYDIQHELMISQTLKLEDSETHEADSSIETKEIILTSAFYNIIHKYFLFAEYLIIAYSNDLENFIEFKNISKQNHLNNITNNKISYKLFLSANFEFYEKLKNNIPINYTHARALTDAAEKYKFYDTNSLLWVNSYKTIEKNYENWRKNYKDDPLVLNYVITYQNDENLL